MRDSRNGDPERREQLRDVHCRRLALNGEVRGDNDLLDAAVDSGHKFLQPDVVGTHVFGRRNDAVEHVVAAVKLERTLNAHDVARVLHNADDRRVPRGVGADVADLLVGHVLADLAKAERLFGLDHSRRKVLDFLVRESENVKSHALRGLLADAGKRRKLLYQFGDALRIKGHKNLRIITNGRLNAAAFSNTFRE